MANDRRELEEIYFSQLDAVKKLNENITTLNGDLKVGKIMFNDLNRLLLRARKQYLRTEAELNATNAEL